MATKESKQAVVEEVKAHLENSEAIYLADYAGISVADVTELRQLFKKEEIPYKVFKNTLVKRAMDEVGGYEAFYPFLVQQNAFIFAKDELGKPAQILKEFLKSHKQPAFRGAIVDGAVYNNDQLDALASMKSKQEVIGDIIGLLLSPINNIVGGLQSQGSNIVGALKTLAEKEN